MKLSRNSELNSSIPAVGNLTAISTTNSGPALGGTGTSEKLKRGRKLKTLSKDGAGNSIKKKKRGRKSIQENQATTASTSDEDEECSASNCVRPAGNNIYGLLTYK